MRSIRLAAAALVALVCSADAAHAQDRNPCAEGTVCAGDPATVMAAMQKAGMKPRLGTDNLGDPLIEGDSSTYQFEVHFWGCENHRNCDSLRFEVDFRKEDDNTLDLANKWNSAHRFLQASVMPDGRFVTAYDLATIGGVNDRNFADVLDWWNSKLGELGDFFREVLKPEEKAPEKPAK